MDEVPFEDHPWYKTCHSPSDRTEGSCQSRLRTAPPPARRARAGVWERAFLASLPDTECFLLARWALGLVSGKDVIFAEHLTAVGGAGICSARRRGSLPEHCTHVLPQERESMRVTVGGVSQTPPVPSPFPPSPPPSSPTGPTVGPWFVINLQCEYKHILSPGGLADHQMGDCSCGPPRIQLCHFKF